MFTLIATIATLSSAIASSIFVPERIENVTLDFDLKLVMLQGFDWDVLSDRNSHFGRLNGLVNDMKNSGITALWIPPISQSVDTQGYLPQEWYKLVGESNLRNLVNNLNNNGIMPIADVVVNHRTAPSKDSCTGDYTLFKNPDMGNWAVVSNDQKCEGGLFCKSGCNCGSGDTGENICYAPDLDHNNSGVQNAVKDFVKWLRNNIGFKGIRWDVAKGFSAKYFGDYIVAGTPDFSVGEYWDGDAQKVVSWIDGTGGRSTAFDFPTRYQVRDKIKANNYSGLNVLPGVLKLWPMMSVTFVDNHDTTHSGDPFGTQDQVLMMNAYILTHSGTPCIYYSHWLNYRTQINAMISARKATGVNANSKVNVVASQSGLYAAYIDDRIAMKLGTNSWSPSTSDYKLHTSGNNYAIWIK